MEKVRIRKIIEDIIITQFLNKDMTDLVYKIITEGHGK